MSQFKHLIQNELERLQALNTLDIQTTVQGIQEYRYASGRKPQQKQAGSRFLMRFLRVLLF